MAKIIEGNYFIKKKQQTVFAKTISHTRNTISSVVCVHID